jgi:hypothetical protein
MNDFLDRHKNYLKYLLLLSLLTFVILFISSAAHGAWYSDWNYRKKITIHSSRVSGGTHSNFPVLIKLTSDADLEAYVQYSNGGDILFTSSDETTKIPHEIESFNISTGALVAWVRVDSISSSFNPDIYIYMYYGKSGVGDQQNATGVWDSNYKGVWHLEEPVTNNSSASSVHQDSTSNNNDGNQINNNDLSAKIAEGQDFEGDARDEYVEIPNSASLQNVQEGNYTVEAWFYSDTTPPGSGSAWNAAYSIVQKRGWHVGISMNEYRQFSMAHWLTGDVQTVTESGAKSNTTWYHVAGVLSKTAGYTKIYVNGVNEGTDTFTPNTAAKEYSTTTWRIGIANTNRAEWAWPANGKIDEARISSVARSADWIKTSYNNQVWPNTAVTPSPTPSPNPNGGFITVGSYESGGGVNVLPVVEAGAPKTIGLPDTDVVLDDATATDSDSGPSSLITTWSQVSGPATVTFAPDVNTLNPVTVSGLTLAGDYVLKLSAYDGEATVEDTVTITVNPASSLDLSGYSCNMKITILGSQVQGGPHDDFPVLISLTDESLTTSGCGFVTSDDGYDILFTNSSKSSQLAHEIEKYDKDAGELLAWVKVDLNANPSNTDIYMYYGKSGVGDQQNPTGVWDSNYKGVWHLKESGNGTAGEFIDSSGTNHGQGGGGTSYRVPSQETDGQIGVGQDFDGGDYISVPHNTSLNLTSGLTMEAWVKLSNAANDQKVVGKTDSAPATRGYILGVLNGHLRPEIWNSSGTRRSFESGNISSNQWTHLATTWTTGGNMIGYVNGSQVNSISAYSTNIGTSTNPLYIGVAPYNHSQYYVNGDVDEVRISATARSADWIKTEFNNQNDPLAFRSVEKQCPDSAPPISEFSCSIPITIDSSKVSGTSDLVDFPVLISLTNISLKSTANCGYVQSTNGYDIIFSDAAQTTRLDHEIEKYDSASGEFVAWVRIPTLSVENDTTIYVHFGHSGVCGSPENPTGVWDSNYTGVWHLDDQSNIEDSTSYNNDGTPYNVNDDTGKIGGGQDFDGNDYITVADNSSLNVTSGLTMEAWVNLNACNNQKLVGKTNSTHTRGYVLGIAADCTVYPEIWDSGGTSYAWNGYGTALSASQWGHVATTWTTGGNMIGYVNGSQVRSISAGSNPIGTGAETAAIGVAPWDKNSYWTNGLIDEVRISKVARTDGWIKTSYNNQSDPASFYSVGASSCFLGGFSCNRNITISGDKVSGSGNLTDFPVLIKIENDCNLKTSANGGHIQDSNGYDILFTDASGATQLDHEIEKYDGVRGDLTAWVKVPTLNGSSDTEIYMYYGKSGLTCDPANPAGVWSNSYRGVWHLHDTSGNTQDSTSYNTDGVLSGTITRGAAGEIDNAFDFYTNGQVSWGNPADDHLNAGTGSWTVSLWANIDNRRGDWEKIIRKGKDSWEPGYEFEIDGSNNILHFAINDGSYSEWGVDSSISFSLDTWTYFVGVVDRSNDLLRTYKDGVQVDTSGISSIGSINDNDYLLTGTDDWGWPDALIEEVRLSNTVRSADWIRTEYDNQRDPTSFIIMGNDSCGGQYGFNYAYCKKITVDHTQVNSDLSNFPLLVNITADDDLKTVANDGRVYHSLGYDISFYSPSCGQLDHEIEKYDGSAGTLIAWVKVPTLSASTDTEIYMYYGDSSVTCSPENPPGVWDSDYRAVWHLHDDLEDSTSNNNDGTGNGTSNDTGKIADAESFDGSDDYISVADNASLDVTSGLTMEAWVRLSNAGNNQKIVGKVNSTYTRGYIIGVDDGLYPEIWNNQGTNHVFNSGSISSSQWTHLATTWTTGGNMRGYINGSQVNSISAGSYDIGTNSDALIIGAAPWNPSTFEVSGRIDEVRVSATARSADWIMAEYKNQNDPGNFYTIGSCFEQTTKVTEGWEEEVQ